MSVVKHFTFFITFLFAVNMCYAVPTNEGIVYENVGDHCFKGEHVVKVSWKINIGNWVIENDSDVVITAENGVVVKGTGSATITYNKPGSYSISTKITYTDTSTGSNNGKKASVNKDASLKLVEVNFLQNGNKVSTIDIIKNGNEKVTVEIIPSDGASIRSEGGGVAYTGSVPGEITISVEAENGEIIASVGSSSCKTLVVQATDADVDIVLVP